MHSQLHLCYTVIALNKVYLLPVRPPLGLLQGLPLGSPADQQPGWPAGLVRGWVRGPGRGWVRGPVTGWVLGWLRCQACQQMPQELELLLW
jgi:hypothetical protein